MTPSHTTSNSEQEDNAAMNNTTSCVTCGGTGTILSHKSWFTADGFKRCRCPICGGSGQSLRGFTPDSGYVAFQAKARAQEPTP